MSYNQLGSEGMTYVAEALKLNGTLNCLYLRNTNCDNEGVAALADMLHSNKTLTKLFISNENLIGGLNIIGKNEAVALASALQVNNSLKELHLTCNCIKDEGLKCLKEALLVNTTLESLCVQYLNMEHSDEEHSDEEHIHEEHSDEEHSDEEHSDEEHIHEEYSDEDDLVVLDKDTRERVRKRINWNCYCPDIYVVRKKQLLYQFESNHFWYL